MSDKAQSLAQARDQALKTSAARERLTALFDSDSFVEIGALVKTGCDGAGVITGRGLVEGRPVYAFSQDVSEKSGAVGTAQGSKIKKLYDLALKTGAPVVGIYDSNGADLQDGLGAMAAYGEMLHWSNSLSGVVPQVSLVLGVCAGSAALLAASADFVVMSEKAELFLTVADAESAASADNAAKSGVAHLVEKDDQDAIKAARKLLSRLPSNNLDVLPEYEYAEQAGASEGGLFEKIAKVADANSIVELQKDFACGCGARVALATLGGRPAGLVAASDSGKLGPDGAAKIARFVSICDSFHIPVITFVDCEGFGGDSRRAVREAAKLAHVYAQATTPKIAVVTGKAYGSAFITLAGRSASADFVVAWPDAVISALSPATAIAFMGGERITADKTREQAEAEYAAVDAGALAAAAGGHIDDVIEPAQTRDTLLAALDMLEGKRVSTLPKKHANIPM